MLPLSVLLDRAIPVRSGRYSFLVESIPLKDAVSVLRVVRPAGKGLDDQVRVVLLPGMLKIAANTPIVFLEIAIPVEQADVTLPAEGVVFSFDLSVLARIATNFHGALSFEYDAARANLTVISGPTRLELATQAAPSLQPYHIRLAPGGLSLARTTAPETLADAVQFVSTLTRKASGEPSPLSQLCIRTVEGGKPLEVPMAIGANPAGTILSLYRSRSLTGMACDIPFEAILPLLRVLRRATGQVELHRSNGSGSGHTLWLIQDRDLYLGFQQATRPMPAFAKFLDLKPEGSAEVKRTGLLDVAKRLTPSLADNADVVYLRQTKEGLTLERRDETGRVCSSRVASCGAPFEAAVPLAALIWVVGHGTGEHLTLSCAPPVLTVRDASENHEAVSVIALIPAS